MIEASQETYGAEMARRNLLIGSFDVLGEVVAAADEVLPIVVEANADTGDVIAVHTWPLSEPHRGRDTVSGVALTASAIVVASPAAGGVVQVDRSSGEVRVVSLPWEPEVVIADDDCAWVVSERVYPPDPDSPRRPVVWDDNGYDWSGRQRPPADERVGPSTPVIELRGHDVREMDFGGVVHGLGAVNGRLVAVVQRPTDPVIMKTDSTSSVGVHRPSTVVIADRACALSEAGSTNDCRGVVSVTNGRLWLLDYVHDWDRAPVQEVVIDPPGLRDPLPVSTRDPVGVVAGIVVDLDFFDEDDPEGEPSWPPGQRAARLSPEGGGESRTANLGRTSWDRHVPTDQSVWFTRPSSHTLVELDVVEASARIVEIDLDLAPFAPEPTPRAGLDLTSFEQASLRELEAEFLDAAGSGITGVTFESVTLEGGFPHTAVLGLFRSEERPGLRFGRRWRLYDDLGNEKPVRTWAHDELTEDVESGGHGLPPVAYCTPDADGIVWF